MKCGRCGYDNEERVKFCPECGFDLQMDQNAARLFGQEVEVLFFFEPQNPEKVTGIVNPTLDEFQKHKLRGVVQRVLIGSAVSGAEEGANVVLPFIRKSLEFLGESYDEERYRHTSLPELKKEYLRLFERVLKVKAQRQDLMKPPPKIDPPKK